MEEAGGGRLNISDSNDGETSRELDDEDTTDGGAVSGDDDASLVR